MSMLSAKELMDQSAMTADTWMRRAKEDVDNRFEGYPAEAKAVIIAGYMQAAGLDEIAMHQRALVEQLEQTTIALQALNEIADCIGYLVPSKG